MIKNKNLNIKPFCKLKHKKIITFYPIDFIEVIIGINNKLSSMIVNKKKKLSFETYTNYLVPKNSLNYISEEAFLKDKKLTKQQVIQNSISYIHKEMDKEQIDYLTEQFKILVKKHKIRVTKKDNIPIYSEILFILNYIKNIQAIIRKYPTYWTNLYGTKFRASSEKNLVNTQLTYLKECLNNPFFPITNKKEIEKITMQIKFLEKSILPENQGIAEFFNHAESLLGLDHKLMGFSKHEQNTIKQLLSFYNGIRCKKEELVKSSMIYMRSLSKIDDKKDHQILVDSIKNISYNFFDYVYKESKEKSKSKDKKIRAQSAYKQLIFTKKQLSNEFHVKTTIDNTKVFVYTHKNSFDYISKMLEIFINNIFGFQNIFEPDLPKEEDASDWHILKSIATFKKEIGFTKKEFQYLTFAIMQAK